MKKIILLLTLFFYSQAKSQYFLQKTKKASCWVDSVFNSLTYEQKIAQLFIIRAHSNLKQEHVDKVTELIKKYNIGGLCFFQGGPIRQAQLTNYYQSIAATPLLISIDAEWGLGMRLDSVQLFPKNMMLGAVQNTQLIYKVGNAIGKQCKRMGIHINYAPVVDVNNNPANPVINDRSFGENKLKVSEYAIQYSKGLQAAGVVACAKHFPGHGDVAVDSHLDLPVINKTFSQIDDVELYPFKQMIAANVGSIMTAHLSVPCIDTTKNLPTSLSKNAITNLLKKQLNFKGLVITDGLEMKGVTKYYASGDVSAKALIAGNDLLLLPEQIDSSIEKIKLAIQLKQLSKTQLHSSVKKVLLAKYNLGLNKKQLIDTANLVNDLNASTPKLVSEIAANAITIVKQSNKNILPINNAMLPYDLLPKVAHIIIGNGKENMLSNRTVKDFNATTYFFNNSFSAQFKVRDSIEPKTVVALQENNDKFIAAQKIVDSIKNKYDVVIISVHQYNRRPANNFGLDSSSVYLMQQFANNNNAIFLFFGNAYAVRNVCNAKNVVACYDDDELVQQAAANILQGKIKAVGKLPVTVCNN